MESLDEEQKLMLVPEAGKDVEGSHDTITPAASGVSFISSDAVSWSVSGVDKQVKI